MNPNLSATDQFAIISQLDPASRLGGGFPSSFADCKLWHSFVMIAQVGTFPVGATFDARLQQCTDSSGTITKNIPGKAITTLLAAGGSNKQVLVNLRPDELDLAGGFGFIRMVLNTSGTTTFCSAMLLGLSAKWSPASIANVSSVVQLIG
jgi:hypothetical protein